MAKTSKDISRIRENYSLSSLHKSDLTDNPIDFFRHWLDASLEAELTEPTAMTLSTISKEGRPTARIVLLKELSNNGFIFYTNYQSSKGQEIALNQNVALTFLWKELQRQVRVEGHATKVSKSKSEIYFQSRPKKSQMGAWVSQQSQIIDDRSQLEYEMQKLANKYHDVPFLPLPPNWGGYEITPNYFEFWQGRRSRLHDRLVYQLSDNEWIINRLSP